MHSLNGKKIVVASHNAGKLREFADLLGPFGLEAKSAKEFGLPEPDETGTTFEQNAYIKAHAAAAATGLPALSDDSGLMVDALDGAPGVYTANWAEKPDGSRDFGMAMQRTEVALQEVGATEQARRGGRFVAVICLVFPDGEAEYYRGEVEGTLVWPPRGELGFGYDPVFLPDGYDKTFGEMTAAEKHGWKPGDAEALSHRARAFKKFAEARLRTV
jgi:XTP/dITP diphosphohydrolase